MLTATPKPGVLTAPDLAASTSIFEGVSAAPGAGLSACTEDIDANATIERAQSPATLGHGLLEFVEFMAVIQPIN